MSIGTWFTGSYVLWSNKAYGTASGDYIELISPPLQSHAASCLTFWYFYTTIKNGQLTVSLLVDGKSQHIWSPPDRKTSNQPWTEASVSLPAGGDKFQVVLLYQFISCFCHNLLSEIVFINSTIPPPFSQDNRLFHRAAVRLVFTRCQCCFSFYQFMRRYCHSLFYETQNLNIHSFLSADALLRGSSLPC